MIPVFTCNRCYKTFFRGNLIFAKGSFYFMLPCHYQWHQEVLNFGPLVSEVTTLPIVPQPLPYIMPRFQPGKVLFDASVCIKMLTKRFWEKGCKNGAAIGSSTDSFVSTILRSKVGIPSTPSTLIPFTFSPILWLYLSLCLEKDENNKKRPGLAQLF